MQHYIFGVVHGDDITEAKKTLDSTGTISRHIIDILLSRFPDYGRDSIISRIGGGEARAYTTDTLAGEIVGAINISLGSIDIDTLLGTKDIGSLKTSANRVGATKQGIPNQYKPMDLIAQKSLGIQAHNGQTIIPAIIASKYHTAHVLGHSVYGGEPVPQHIETIARYELEKIRTRMSSYYGSMFCPGKDDVFSDLILRPYIGSGGATEQERMESRMGFLHGNIRYAFASTHGDTFYDPVYKHTIIQKVFDAYEKAFSLADPTSTRLLGPITCDDTPGTFAPTVYEMISDLYVHIQQNSTELAEKIMLASTQSGYLPTTIIATLMAGIHMQTIDKNIEQHILSQLHVPIEKTT